MYRKKALKIIENLCRDFEDYYFGYDETCAERVIIVEIRKHLKKLRDYLKIESWTGERRLEFLDGEPDDKTTGLDEYDK